MTVTVCADGRSGMPQFDEPDWSDALYAEQLTDAERLALERSRGPGGRDSTWLGLVDPTGLSSPDRLDLLAVLDQQVRWLQAAMVRTLAAVDADDRSAKKYAQEEVSLALQIPVRTAQNRMREARLLISELPNTFESFSNGQISHDQARTLTDAVWKLPATEPDLVARLERAVLPKAPMQTNAQFRVAVKRTAAQIDPASAEQRHQRALADRTVRLEPADEGMVQLPVLLDAISGQLIYTRLTAAATMLPSTDARTMDQRRADLFVDAMLTGLPLDSLPQMQGRRPAVNVVVAADTLLGLDDDTAHLTGYGTITAETARQLAADESGTWRRLLTDPNTGDLLDVSPDTYRPAARLRAFALARDDVCAFPTCNQPGYRCEYEHIIEFLAGGRTCRCNSAVACRRHNQCKIDSAWSYARNGDGSFTWTTAAGKTYTSASARSWSTPEDRLAAPATSSVPKERKTLAELWLQDDQAYQLLLQRWRSERKAAKLAQDQYRLETARQALAGVRRQRQRELAHRKDPTTPPY